MTTTVKVPKPIRPSLNVSKVLDADLLTRINAIEAGLAANPAYPSPPVDPATLKAAADAYKAAIAAATDGSKTAIAVRHKERAQVVAMMRLDGAYVESVSNGNMPTFLSSGFQPVIRVVTPAQPLATPSIVRVDQGVTGQLLVTIKKSAKAKSYELRYAPLGAGGVPGTFTSIPVANVKQATPVGGLTPGTTYEFEVRALGKLGFTDWSDSVERMTI